MPGDGAALAAGDDVAAGAVLVSEGVGVGVELALWVGTGAAVVAAGVAVGRADLVGFGVGDGVWLGVADAEVVTA